MKDFWQHIKRFKPEEFNHPDRMDHLVILLLDEMVKQETIRMPGLQFIVHSDFREGDPGDHGKGWAVDGHFQLSNGIVLASRPQFLICARYQWTALGVYPFWKRPGVHLARRRLALWERRKFWWKDFNGKYRAIEDFFY